MEALDDSEYEGNLLYLLKVFSFVKEIIERCGRKVQYIELNTQTIQKELSSNSKCLVHRDYTIIGSEVHIDIYDDRIEMYLLVGCMMEHSYKIEIYLIYHL